MIVLGSQPVGRLKKSVHVNKKAPPGLETNQKIVYFEASLARINLNREFQIKAYLRARIEFHRFGILPVLHQKGGYTGKTSNELCGNV